MLKRWLKNFEFHINPATWNSAQDLVQAGAVRNLREVERHFWVALVEDGEGAFETEMMITPHKIKAYTCECFTEGRHLMCAHVAASLLKVRQFLEQRSDERRSRSESAAPSERSRLTVQTTLESTTYDTLLEFVREYARRDRDFSLALKTWFAGSVTGSENPYALVLDSVIPKSAANKSMREPDFRRLRHTFDDLNNQYDAAFAHQNFRTAFLISSSVLLKALPLVQKTEESRRDQLLHFSRQALRQLTGLQAAPVSPELRVQIWDLIFDLGMRALWPSESVRDAIHALCDANPDEDQAQKIRDGFDQTPFPAPPFTLQLFLATLAKKHFPAAVVRVLEDYSGQPGLLKEAILQLYYLDQWDAATHAIEHFSEQNTFTGAQRRELDDVLLVMAEKTGDVERQVRILKDRFILSGHFDFFSRLKAVASENWPVELERLLQSLRQKNDVKNIAAVLASEGQKNALASLLESSGNLFYLQRYEDLFLAEDKNFIRERYITFLSDYLREHFGRQASAQVRQQLTGLLQKGETALVGDIIRELITRFEDRHTLPEELAEMFPKYKRKSVLSPP